MMMMGSSTNSLSTNSVSWWLLHFFVRRCPRDLCGCFAAYVFQRQPVCQRHFQQGGSTSTGASLLHHQRSRCRCRSRLCRQAARLRLASKVQRCSMWWEGHHRYSYCCSRRQIPRCVPQSQAPVGLTLSCLEGVSASGSADATVTCGGVHPADSSGSGGDRATGAVLLRLVGELGRWARQVAANRDRSVSVCSYTCKSVFWFSGVARDYS